MIQSFKGMIPVVHPTAFVHPQAVVSREPTDSDQVPSLLEKSESSKNPLISSLHKQQVSRIALCMAKVNVTQSVSE